MPVRINPFEGSRAATEDDVVHFQMGLGAVLPNDYREFLLKHNGGYPEPSGFANGNLVNAFFGFCQKHGCLRCEYYIHRPIFPFGVIPIGDDAAGNKICLIVAGPDSGKVLFWDHEQEGASDLRLLADSFSAFLDSLYDDPSVFGGPTEGERMI